jgi:hypothetical protein
MVMLRAAGLFLAVMGTIWMLQGAGVLSWPAESFMLAQQQWVIYGALTAMVGAFLFWGAGRIRR